LPTRQATSRFGSGLRRPTPAGAGAQWKANQFPPSEIALRHLTCASNPKVCAPPYYGWVTLGQGFNRAGAPLSLIIVMTSFSRTPSVASAVESLRTRGHGANYGPTTPVKLAGFSGSQFDGQVVGPRHVFIPFSPPTNAATGYPDGIYFEAPGPFRFIVVNVRGKTVVVMISTQVMTADAFTSYLPKTNAILNSQRFPG
jgi:hypothetical protein